MPRITGEIVIDAPGDVVFDFVAGQRNEPPCNSHMVRSAKVTPGPAGTGTRFRSAVRPRSRLAGMAIEYTGFQRRSRLASTTRMAQAELRGTLTFEPAGAGTRLLWSRDARFTWPLRLLAPVLAGWADGRNEGRRQGSSGTWSPPSMRRAPAPGSSPAPHQPRGCGRERQPAARPDRRHGERGQQAAQHRTRGDRRDGPAKLRGEHDFPFVSGVAAGDIGLASPPAPADSLRPLPRQWTLAPLRRVTSPQVSAVSSETRRPVCAGPACAPGKLSRSVGVVG